MVRAMCFVVVVLAGAFGSAGCKKDEPKQAGESAPVVSAAKDCGTDFADPQKEFCVTIPAGYKANPPDAPDVLYSELINVNGPSSGFTVTVGFTSSNWKTYDDQLKADEALLKLWKVESSGKTAGTGQWWVYTRTEINGAQVMSTVKSNGDKALRCTPNNMQVAPEVIAACKSLRAYPK